MKKSSIAIGSHLSLYSSALSYKAPGGDEPIVQDVDVEIRPGELIGVIGPNGAGKSTLLKLLVGFLKPSAGTVGLESNGARRPLSSFDSKERAQAIAYMSQGSPESFAFSVVEMVEMGSFSALAFGRSPGSKERDAALDALRYVGMYHLAGRSFPTLSGGEKQLVLFARLLVQNSPLLLLDEPTAALDLGHEAQLLEMTRELCAEGKGALVAIHNLNSAAHYCDRLVLLDRGRIKAQGIPSEVLTQEHLEASYGNRIHVGVNESSGSLSVTALAPKKGTGGPRVHVIGGAGSGVNITRFLHREGWQVSGGVAHELDSDAKLWRALGIPFVQAPAFAEIDDASVDQAMAMVDQSELCILCSFPFGKGNLRNLELASRASKLVILDQESGTCRREFFIEGAEELFASLVERAGGLVSYDRLEENLTRWPQSTLPNGELNEHQSPL